jgi:hypothetical protein
MLNRRGITIVETLVMMALLALVISLYAGFIVSQKKQAAFFQLKSLSDEYMTTIQSTLSFNSSCNSILRGQSGSISSGALKNLFSGTFSSGVSMRDYINGTLLYNSTFQVKSLSIVPESLRNEQTSKSFVDQTYLNKTAGVNREYLGDMKVEIEVRPEVLAKLSGLGIQGDSFQRETSIQIKIFNESASSSEERWEKSICAVQNSEEAAYKAQICNLYGGFLIDGAYCDFTGVIRQHNSDKAVAPNNVPVQSFSQSGNGRGRRVRLEEIICYIDNLSVLTANLASVTVVRRATEYCRHPAGTEWSKRSKDAKRFFN